jgi:Protein of unknown function (DUF4235)
MRFFYRLFSRITGGFAARIGKLVFESLWSRIDHEAPPAPTKLDASLAKVVVGATLEAATMAGVAAVVERVTASTFAYLFGVSPEPKQKQQSDTD